MGDNGNGNNSLNSVTKYWQIFVWIIMVIFSVGMFVSQNRSLGYKVADHEIRIQKGELANVEIKTDITYIKSAVSRIENKLDR